MGSLIGVLVETHGSEDWSFRPELVTRGPAAPFVWIEIPATLFSIGDVESIERFAADASRHFGGRAWSVLAQTTSTCQYVVAFDNGEEVRRIGAEETNWVFSGEPSAWEEVYFFGDRANPDDGFYIGESDEEWERFCTASPEELAAEGLMMPHIEGVQRLLELHGTSWSEPFATFTPAAATHRRWGVWAVVAAVLAFWAFMIWLGAR